MYKVERSALVGHSAQQMFELVNDVDRYEEFLPWCGGSRVLERDESSYVASVDIAFKGIRKSFTTRNSATPGERIDVDLVDGPFRKLTGHWAFKDLGDEGSRIGLELEFDFAGGLIGRVLGPVFKIIADSMVDSFTREADKVYR